MKKLTLSIIGIVLQVVGIGLMIFNINNETKSFLWIGFAIVFVGLAFAIVGMFVTQKSKK